MKKFCLLCLLLFLTLISLPQSAAAQIKFSALTTLGYTGLDRESKINGMFRGDDPFNPVRVTLFMEDWINPRLGVFIEFLWDQGASHSGSDTKPRVNGAYAVARPFDTDAFLLKIGMIPSSFGTWAPRTCPWLTTTGRRLKAARCRSMSMSCGPGGQTAGCRWPTIPAGTTAWRLSALSPGSSTPWP